MQASHRMMVSPYNLQHHMASMYSHLILSFLGHVGEFNICNLSSSADHAGSTILGRHDVRFIPFRYCLLSVHGPKAVGMETGAFILIDDIIKLCFGTMMSFSDWLKRAQGCHLVGISCFSHAFKCKKVNLPPTFEESGRAFLNSSV